MYDYNHYKEYQSISKTLREMNEAKMEDFDLSDEYEILNESSSLSSLGVTDKQLKALYARDTYVNMSIPVPKADATYTLLSSKDKAVKALKNANNIYQAVVVGVSKDGILYCAIGDISYSRGDSKYHIIKVTPEGNRDYDVVRTATNALASFKKVSAYYFTELGKTILQPAKDEQQNNDALVERLTNLIMKDAEKMFADFKKQAIEKANQKMLSGDFAGAQKIMSKFTRTYGNTITDAPLEDFVINRFSGKKLRFYLGEIVAGKNYASYDQKIIDKILNSANDKQLKLAGAELLRQVRAKLVNAFNDNLWD